MTKTVSIHQPNYIPWIGYFYKIFKSDIFVILDDVQYVKRGYINRNQIKTHNGVFWLTIPVENKGNYGCKINEVIIHDDSKWKENHLKNIEVNYKKSNYFHDFYDIFKTCLMKDFSKLSDLNIYILKEFCKLFDIKTEMILSSEFNMDSSGTKRIVDICKAVGADKYLSGKGGMKYQNEKFLEENGIQLEYSDFYPGEYKQQWGDFISSLSIIDYIFNCGYDIKKNWQ